MREAIRQPISGNQWQSRGHDAPLYESHLMREAIRQPISGNQEAIRALPLYESHHSEEALDPWCGSDRLRPKGGSPQLAQPEAQREARDDHGVDGRSAPDVAIGKFGARGEHDDDGADSEARAVKVRRVGGCLFLRARERGAQVSDAIRGNQRQSEAIRGTQRHSDAITCVRVRVSPIPSSEDPKPVHRAK